MSDYLTLHKRTEAEARAERYGKWLLSSLREFHIQLSDFDWSSETSRDPGVYSAGQRRLGELRSIADLSPQHLAMFRAFEAYHGGLNRWMGKRAEYDATHELPRCP